MIYARVIVNISHENLDKTYEYAVPKEWESYAVVGAQVLIPFGAGNRKIEGFILQLSDTPEFDPERIKSICSVITTGTVIEGHFIKLAAWIREQYGGTMNDALRAVLTVKKTVKEQEKKFIHLAVERQKLFSYMEECERKHYKARLRLLTALEEQQVLDYQEAVKAWKISRDAIRKVEELGIITISRERTYRNPIKETVQEERKVLLTLKQKQIAEEIIEGYQQGQKQVCYIHGVTGSGKTEVYMEVMEHVIAGGKQVIFLIPEIALTVQMVERFYKRFGNRVSVLHSRLSDGERYDQYTRAQQGEVDIMIGPRSALFTPFQNLGMIVMDEEHEPSYKSESMPKYHARETAMELAKMHGASVVLGSATPSLEAYYRAKKGEYKLFTLKERLTGGMLPTVYTVDLREELKQGNRSVFSRKLKELMEDRLEKRQQIMLFLNRRGYAGFVSCRACGLVLKCPHCDVSLSEHRGGRLICHYCGYEQPAVNKCPDCGSKYILGFKAGTEQVEELVKKEFPHARVLRMDADTTRKKESYEQILSSFANGEADILVGTQMIVKGHDFPNVTLVGILAADMSLSANDYRAGERTFQLLTQAAGRAGRGEKPGEVVIQTYQPEHYSIVHAAEQNYEAFYEAEMCYRDLLSYPPAAHMMAVQITAKEEERGEKLSVHLSNMIKEEYKDRAVKLRLSVIGPAKAGIGKINDIYRYVFYVKCREYVYLTQIKDKLEEEIFTLQLKNEMVQFDFDPMNTF